MITANVELYLDGGEARVALRRLNNFENAWKIKRANLIILTVLCVYCGSFMIVCVFISFRSIKCTHRTLYIHFVDFLVSMHSYWLFSTYINRYQVFFFYLLPTLNIFVYFILTNRCLFSDLWWIALRKHFFLCPRKSMICSCVLVIAWWLRLCRSREPRGSQVTGIIIVDMIWWWIRTWSH